MTEKQCQAISANRLREWGRKLAGKHCTPMIMLATGHDAHAGEIHICIVDALETTDVIAALTAARDQLIARGEPK
jgi:hypothetical protein